jgi:hypothetical protein
LGEIVAHGRIRQARDTEAGQPIRGADPGPRRVAARSQPSARNERRSLDRSHRARLQELKSSWASRDRQRKRLIAAELSHKTASVLDAKQYRREGVERAVGGPRRTEIASAAQRIARSGRAARASIILGLGWAAGSSEWAAAKRMEVVIVGPAAGRRLQPRDRARLPAVRTMPIADETGLAAQVEAPPAISRESARRSALDEDASGADSSAAGRRGGGSAIGAGRSS